MTELSNTSTQPPLRILSSGAEWLSVRAGGLNRYTSGLCDALAKTSPVSEQRWLTMGDRTFRPNKAASVEAVATSADSLLKRWRAVHRAAGDLTDADVIASHFALYAFPIRRRLARMPHVVHFHGPWADESDVEGAGGLTVRVKRVLERSVYRTGDRLITLSQAFAEVLTSRYRIDPQRIRIVPGGIDVSGFGVVISKQEARRLLGWEPDRPTIVCVRRLVRRMGLEQLIEAIGEVWRTYPDLTLKIAGKGPLSNKLAAQIEGRGLGNTVKLLGFVPDAQLPLVYAAADFSIVPTQSLEGFGLITLESLSCGTPVLVCPVGGLPEVVRGLDSSLILSGSSVGSIAEGIHNALSQLFALPSPERCRAYAREHFDWSVIASRVLQVYQEAIDAHG